MSAGASLDGILRLKAVLQRFPVSRSTWLSGVRSGRYPQPVRLSIRCVGWRESQINELVKGKSA